MEKINQLAYKALNLHHRKRITGYYSQYGQDKYIADILKNKQNGVFVDIGANDGVALSNSYYFEKELNWTGIAIEPSPVAFQKLRENRNCTIIQACISDYDGETPFQKLEGRPQMLSGIPSKYSQEHIDRIEKTIKEHGGKKEDIVVPCYTLNSILTSYEISIVDYLSIDTEGGEFDILKTIDFDNFYIGTISIENNYQDSSIRKLLVKNNYALKAILGCDEIYKKLTIPDIAKYNRIKTMNEQKSNS